MMERAGTAVEASLTFEIVRPIPKSTTPVIVATMQGDYTLKVMHASGVGYYTWRLYKGTTLLGSANMGDTTDAKYWTITFGGYDTTGISVYGRTIDHTNNPPAVAITSATDVTGNPAGDWAIDLVYAELNSFFIFHVDTSAIWKANRLAAIQAQWQVRVVVGDAYPNLLMFENDKLIDLEITEKIDPLGLTVPVNSCTFTIENYDYTFSPDNPANNLSLLSKGSLFKVQSTFDGYPGSYQDNPEHWFLVDTVEADDSSNTVTVTGVGTLSLLDVPFIDRTYTGHPRHAYGIVADIFAQTRFSSVQNPGIPAMMDTNGEYWAYAVYSEADIPENAFEYKTPFSFVTGAGPFQWSGWELGNLADIYIDLPLENMTCREALARVLTATGQYVVEVDGSASIRPCPIRGHWNYQADGLTAINDSIPLPLYHLGSLSAPYDGYAITKDLMFQYPAALLPDTLRDVTCKVYSVSDILDYDIEKIGETSTLFFPTAPPPPPGGTSGLLSPYQTFTLEHEGLYAPSTVVILEAGDGEVVNPRLTKLTPGTYNTTFEVTDVGYGAPFKVTLYGKKLIKTSEIRVVSFGGNKDAEFDNPLIESPTMLELRLYNFDWEMGRTTYTVSTRNDPRLLLGTNIFLDTRYTLGNIVLLTEAKRTFNGAFRAEYVFN